MKKVLITSLVIFIIGAILLGIGVAIRGFDPFRVTWKNGRIDVEEHQTSDVTLDKTELDSFSNMDIQINVGDINIIPSDQYAIEYALDVIRVDYAVDGDTLVVTTEAKPDVSIAFDIGINNEYYINIYVPSDAVLGNVSLNGNVGDIELDSLSCQSLVISSNTGDINMVQCSVSGRADISSNVGDVAVNGGNYGDAYITSDVGDVNGEALTVNSGLTVNNSVGDTDITLGRGTYSLGLTTDCGDIEVNGREMDDGVSQSYHENNGGVNVVISNSTGDINLNY